MTIIVHFISLIFILIAYYLFISCLNIFTAQKVRIKTVESPSLIPGASTEWESDLRVKPIVEIDIVFLLESGEYSSD